ncbi:heavy metal-associated domain-containing protein [Anaerococcus sp. AGMB09787]|uniref:cation transporter n=1 Tax=Anaerococcus sp. AGMB09787 TaxID=2922869 RepID=UPI001FAFFA30|nr:heavy metal-associated domain-containing protein [Anaerococcus sp. AGMB09787]
MKKRFKFEGLRCANCANKIEDRIKNLEGVLDANVSYFTQSIKLELAEGATLDRIIDESNQIADKIEPGSKIVRK